jgi:hypothetical protein
MSYLEQFFQTHFRVNHRPENKNFNALFLVGFTPDHLQLLASRACQVSTLLNHRVMSIDVRGKSYVDMCKEITCKQDKDSCMGEESLRQFLYEENVVLIIKEMSAMKTRSQSRSVQQIQGMIKLLDNAHLENVRPKTDLVFVDYAGFLQKHWEELGNYVEVNVMALSMFDTAEQLSDSVQANEIFPTIG